MADSSIEWINSAANIKVIYLSAVLKLTKVLGLWREYLQWDWDFQFPL
jgi:hypothetical protein